jgi:type IV pilus assembly protein PilM
VGLFGKKKNLVGLDIGSSSVKAVEMKPGKGEVWTLTTVGIEYLPQEAIVDGQIMDSTSVIDAITRLFSEYKIKTPDVATAISGSSVIVKKIQLPSMSEQELAESIHWEAEQYIPFDIQEVNLDYEILDEGVGGNMDILLVAAKKDKINDYMSVITQAGRNPVVMDIDAFALQNAYEVNYGIEPGRVVALVNIGASQANINILKGGDSIFTRDITTIGGNQFTDAIQKDLNVSFEQAENLKQGQGVEGQSPDAVAPILASVSEQVLMEVQKTFDFFKATTSEDHIDRVVLSGGSARVPGMADSMAERFDCRVELANPFQSVNYSPKDFDAEFLEEVGPACTIAVGLALRKVGDR